jgi:hypothetical protein
MKAYFKLKKRAIVFQSQTSKENACLTFYSSLHYNPHRIIACLHYKCTRGNDGKTDNWLIPVNLSIVVILSI